MSRTALLHSEPSLPAPKRTRRFIPALPVLHPEHFLPRLRPRERLPFPLDLPGERVRGYYLCRAAIAHGLSAYKLPPGAVCLMPAYHHGVEVEAVRAAGLEPRFYRIDRDLRVDLDDLRARLDALGERVRVLYMIHFAGFPAPMQTARRLADDRALVLCEDCALAFLSRMPTGEPLGSFGDLSVFCLYKSVPVPHGGVLVSPRLPAPAPKAPPLLATMSHLGGSLLRHLEARGGIGAAARRALRNAFRVVPAESRTPVGRQHLQPFELDLACSRLLDLLLPNLPYQAIVARRRRNYRRLVERIGLSRVPTGALPPGVCPLFVPVRVPERLRDRVLQHLWSRGIEAVDLWREGFEDPAEFPDSQALRASVIELPCHQDLGDPDVDHVAAVFEEVA